MIGNTLRLVSNDIYGNADDRKICVFACFNHKKYMNNYLIFCYEDEIDNKKIYYGSLHIKNDSIVCFQVNDSNSKNYIDEFISELINDKIDISMYEIIDISKIEKIEIISFNQMDNDNVSMIKEKTIKTKTIEKEIVKEEKNKDPFLLYLLLIVIIIFIDAAYFYFKSGFVTTEYKYMDCSITKMDDRLKSNYVEEKIVKFDKNDKIKKIEVTLEYKFKNEDVYYDFKQNELQYNYFNKGTYKYNDSEQILNVFYDEDSILSDYDEIRDYLRHEGYDCLYGKYKE